jgi:hypothetical protein
VPHNFVFQRVVPGVPVCVLTYKVFSTDKEYLPRRPDARIPESRADVVGLLVDDVALSHNLALVGGDAILNNPAVTKLLDSSDREVKAQATTNNDLLKEMMVVNNMRGYVAEICDDAMIQMLHRFTLESEDHITRLSHTQQIGKSFNQMTTAEARRQIKNVSNNDRGYLMLLNDDPFPGDLDVSKPLMVDIREAIPFAKRNKGTDHHLAGGTDEPDAEGEEQAAKLDAERVGIPPAQRKKTVSRVDAMVAGARTIAKAAQSIHQMFSDLHTITLADPPTAFLFDSLSITKEELDWIEARLTEMDVLQIIAKDFTARDAEVFHLVHFPARSLFYTAASEEQRMKLEQDLIEANIIGTNIFMRPYSTIPEGTEVVGRDNFVTGIRKVAIRGTTSKTMQNMFEEVSTGNSQPCSFPDCNNSGSIECKSTKMKCTGRFCFEHRNHVSHCYKRPKPQPLQVDTALVFTTSAVKTASLPVDEFEIASVVEAAKEEVEREDEKHIRFTTGNCNI